jgi:hypothetical protein
MTSLFSRWMSTWKTVSMTPSGGPAFATKKKRATRFGKWLAPRMEEAVNLRGPRIILRDHVVLRVWPEDASTTGHDHDHLKSAIVLRNRVPVTIVTQDLGLQARAIAADVPVLRLSDDSLLPPAEEDRGDGPDVVD